MENIGKYILFSRYIFPLEHLHKGRCQQIYKNIDDGASYFLLYISRRINVSANQCILLQKWWITVIYASVKLICE